MIQNFHKNLVAYAIDIYFDNYLFALWKDGQQMERLPTCLSVQKTSHYTIVYHNICCLLCSNFIVYYFISTCGLTW